VPDCDHVVLADVQSDSNVGREVEVDGKRDELLVRHQVVSRDLGHVENYHKNIFLRTVDV
jgi:hypothetical protein